MVTREIDGTPVFNCEGNCGCRGCFTGDITYVIGGAHFQMLKQPFAKVNET